MKQITVPEFRPIFERVCRHSGVDPAVAWPLVHNYGGKLSGSAVLCYLAIDRSLACPSHSRTCPIL